MIRAQCLGSHDVNIGIFARPEHHYLCRAPPRPIGRLQASYRSDLGSGPRPAIAARSRRIVFRHTPVRRVTSLVDSGFSSRSSRLGTTTPESEKPPMPSRRRILLTACSEIPLRRAISRLTAPRLAPASRAAGSGAVRVTGFLEGSKGITIVTDLASSHDARTSPPVPTSGSQFHLTDLVPSDFMHSKPSQDLIGSQSHLNDLVSFDDWHYSGGVAQVLSQSHLTDLVSSDGSVVWRRIGS